MKAEDFDKKFESGEGITKYLEISKARRPEPEQKRVNVDFPVCDYVLPISGWRVGWSWRTRT